MWLGLAGSTVMLSSLCGRLVASQLTRMLPPPRLVPSVQLEWSMVPIPGVVGSLVKSLALLNTSPVGLGTLPCELWARVVGPTGMAEAVISVMRSTARRVAN